jgi:hypothetical protein
MSTAGATTGPIWAAAWATYQRATAVWEAAGMHGARPRLSLPIDRPRAVWAQHQTAFAAYRAATQRVVAYLAQADAFDRPSMRRPDIRQAERRIQVAFDRRDLNGVLAAVRQWEVTICGAAA